MQKTNLFLNKKYRAVSAIVVLLVLFIGIFAIKEARKPAPIPNYSSSEKSVETIVVIPDGATGDKIAQILLKLDVVKSARAFFSAATANPQSNRIQPGTYSLNTKISGKEAVEQLLDRKRRLMVLLIKEGERSYELRDDLQRLNFSADSISKFLDEQISVPGFGVQGSEGFLFPATYNLVPDQNIDDLRDKIISKFTSVMEAKDFVNQSKAQGFTPYQMLILASIVQAEGFDNNDFPKIARVIYNRLKMGMPLQMDSTNLYALRERRINVTKSDIAISSKYNSYTNKGLPPSPIGNPGAEALQASIAPATGDWLYFVTVEPKITKFTDSYREFLIFKREFKKNLKAGKFNGGE